jgi:transposase
MKGRKRYIKLELSEKSSLETGWKTGKKSTFRNRCHYILLSNQRMTINEIGAIYNKGYQAISRWLNRYEKEGISGLHTGKGKGRPAIIRIDNESEIKKVEELVEKYPKNLKVVVAKIKEELGKEMSVKTLQRILKKNISGSVLEK